MLMINPKKAVTRERLGSIRTPEPTSSWKPISHKGVADALLARCQARGLQVKNESWMVCDGAYLEGNTKVAVRDSNLFGVLDFNPDPGMDLPPGCEPSISIRNSHSKQFRLSFSAGARVLVCSNGMMLRQNISRDSRKHTSQIDYLSMIDSAVDGFVEDIRTIGPIWNQLRTRQVPTREGNALIVEMAKRGAISSGHILPAVKNWEEPKHNEFKPRNSWSLYNAVTETMKKQSPTRQFAGFEALNDILIPQAA